MLQAPLFQKYDKKFNFFFAKPISQIVFNQVSAPPTLDYKDIVILSQANEYLKRSYHIKNSAGRNEIFDRIRMLSDFYFGATMLKYQHPMMIITNTKDIFLKRLKRTKKMIASDCSSQQSSQHKSQHSSQAQSFSSSVFLRTISQSQLTFSQHKSNSLIENCRQKNKSYDSQIHDIFDKKIVDFSQSRIQFDDKKLVGRIRQKDDSSLEHLILDLDDVDQDTVLKQYKKIKQRGNLQYQNQMKKKSEKKTSIIITALQNYIPKEQSASSGAYNNYYPKNYRNMKKQPSNYRSNDETIRVSNHNLAATYNVVNSNNTKQISVNRSPSFGAQQRFNEQQYNQKNAIVPKIWPKIEKLDLQNAETRRFPKQRNAVQDSYVPNPHRRTQMLSPSSLLNQQEIEHETIYLTNENSIQNSKAKKSYIRQKATALLQKVRSQQKMGVYEDGSYPYDRSSWKQHKNSDNKYHKYRYSKYD